MKTLDFAYIFGVKTTYFLLIPAYLGLKPDFWNYCAFRWFL